MKKINYAWWIMISCLVILMMTLGALVNTISVFIAPAAADFNVGIGQMTLFMTMIAVGNIISLPFNGRLLQRFNARWVVSICLAVVAICVALLSLATSVVMLYVLGFLIGLFGAMPMISAPPIIINNWFAKKNGFALGLVMAFVGIGGAVFSPIMTACITSLGWRTAYLILAACIAVTTLPFSVFVLRSRPEDLGLRPYGYEDGHTEGAPSEPDSLPGVTFDKAVKSPAFYTVFLFALFFGMLSGMNINMAAFGMSLGYDAMLAAGIVSSTLVGMTVCKVLMGAINDRFKEKTTVLFGAVVGIVGLILLLFASNSYIIALAGGFLFSFGFAEMDVVTPLLARRVFGLKDYGKIFSVIAMAYSISSAVGAPIYGLIFDLTGSYINAVLTMIAFIVTGAALGLVSLSAGKRLTQNPNEVERA